MSAEGRPVLEVRGLVKEYPGVRALDGVDFDVREGEVHCLLGPNGAGKSTLIKCVSGVVEPTEGEILVDGEPLRAGRPGESLDRGVGTIYQELDLVEDLTVAQSVFLGHELRRARLPRPRARCAGRPTPCSSGSATRRSPPTRGCTRCGPPRSRSSRSPAPSPSACGCS